MRATSDNRLYSQIKYVLGQRSTHKGQGRSLSNWPREAAQLLPVIPFNKFQRSLHASACESSHKRETNEMMGDCTRLHGGVMHDFSHLRTLLPYQFLQLYATSHNF